MRVVLMIEGQEGVTWEQWIALAETCERSGVEALFRSDHYASILAEGRSSLDAWATLAGLAARTTRLRLGSLVSPATFRHPSVLAKMATTVDHISGGRVELGMGAGWYEHEHRMYGFPFHTRRVRAALLAEQIEIVKRQWTDAAFDFAGEHYLLERCSALPLPVQRPHPPLIVGGMGGKRTLALAARSADEYNTASGTPSLCRERLAALHAACREVGRAVDTIGFSLMIPCVLGRDRGEVEERLERLQERLGATDARAWAESRGESILLGTLDEAHTRLERFAEAGVQRVFLQQLDHTDLDLVGLAGSLAG